MKDRKSGAERGEREGKERAYTVVIGAVGLFETAIRCACAFMTREIEGYKPLQLNQLLNTLACTRGSKYMELGLPVAVENETAPLHIFFLPFLAYGHMIPMAEIAKTFAARGVKTTLVTTPLNAISFSMQIDRAKQLGLEINIQTVEFPSSEVGLPEGCENSRTFSSSQSGEELILKFFKASRLFQEPIRNLLREHRPDYLVADLLFPWAADVAAEFKIPTLVFAASSFISLCIWHVIKRHEPHRKVTYDFENFLVPDLPGELKMTRNELPAFMRLEFETDFSKLPGEILEAELKSDGIIINSFYELEKDYVDYYKNVFERKAWHIGPISICSRDTEDKEQRGMEASIDKHECWKWLDSKKPNSVIYVCFGSETNFTSQQLMEIALGLESSEQQFIWVVRKEKEQEKDWLPLGFEERMYGRGLIIRGWAPQVLILDHESVGGFMTHCGWNSILEAICAGVPMVTWPVSGDLFCNEKLVTQVHGVGIEVGAKKSVRFVGDGVNRDSIEKALRRVMVGEEAKEMRTKVKALKEMARKAVKEGGSSYFSLSSLIEELKLLRAARESK